MRKKHFIQLVSCFLTVVLGLLLFSGCGTAPGVQTEAYSSVTQSSAAASEATEATSAPETEADTPVPGASWRQIFGDPDLPEDGWLGETQVGFCMEDESGSHSVLVMEISELKERVASLGNLPRTGYYEAYLGEQFDLLLSAYDLAMEIGCGKFSIPTTTLRARDVSEVKDYLEYTFQIYGSRPRFSVTKELSGSENEHFHFLTVLFTNFNREHFVKHMTAIEKARSILDEMPRGLSELETAKYLYEYVAKRVRYDYDNYYDKEDWNCLYDALVLEKAVCSGYAEAIYSLFNLAGIDCLCVDGTIVTEDSVDGHAWNLAKVDCQWYVFDATWDSLDKDDDPYRPRFFGISTQAAEFYSVRTIAPFLATIVPPCDGILDTSYLAFYPRFS